MGQAMVQHAAAAAGGAAAAASSKKIADGLEKILGGAANTAAVAAAPAPTPKPVAPPVVPTASNVAGKRGKPSPFDPQVNRAGGTEMAPSMPRGTAGIPSPTEVETTVSGESLPNNPWSSLKQTHQGSVPAFTPFVSNDAPPVSRGARRGGNGNGPQVADTMMPPPTVSMPAVLIATAIIPPPPLPVRATLEKLAGIQLGANYETILSQLGTPAAKIEMMDDGKVFESLRIEANGSKLGTIHLVNGVVTSVEPVVP